ncbi:MAG: hypothetical protein ACRDWY_17815 [Actinomycetes bacterium]
MRNYGLAEKQWKYEDDKDVPYVVDIWTDQAEIDIDAIVRSLEAVVQGCRLLEI